MMSLARRLARLVEHTFEVRIVRPDRIGLLFEQRHLERFFSRFAIDCVFDVGANAGQYATMIRSQAKYKGPIISFEPNPQLIPVLRERARGDHLWFVEEAALGSQPGHGQLNIMADDKFSSLHRPQPIEMFATMNAVQKTIDVKISTIELELRKYRQRMTFHRPFLKMDTQGHDVEIAKGAGELFSEFIGLQSELAIKQIYNNSPSFEETLRFYRDRGFVLSAFVPNNEGHFPWLIEIDCIMFRGDVCSSKP
jgi:FkbM family methyltransferase